MTRHSHLSIVALLLFTASSYGAYTFSDTLTWEATESELVGNQLYDSTESSMYYLVNYDEGSNNWDYSYTLTVPSNSAGISHLIIETSLRADYFDLSTTPAEYLTGEGSEEVHGWQYVASGNTTMPSDMFGIKIGASDDSDVKALTMSFTSTRAPMWGDFYAKSGRNDNPNSLYNTGFGTNYYFDPDNPDVRANKILVPDTDPTPNVPAPGAFLLAGLGTGFVGYMRRRRTI